MFWVICTNCFSRPVQGNQRKYYITSCSHILCDHCANPGDQRCTRCQSFCRMILYGAEMPDELRSIFCDIGENASYLIKAIEFQDEHRNGIMGHYRTVAQKYNAAKLYIKDVEVKFTTIQQKYVSAKLKIKELQNKLQELNRKLYMYEQMSGPSPAKSPSQPVAQLDFEISRFHRKSPMFRTGQQNNIFTPSYSMHRSMHQPYTPESGGSVKSSTLASTGSYSGRNRSLPGFTPPSKTLELLTLLSKSRSKTDLM